MTESTKREMKFIEGEGIDLNEKNVVTEFDDVIEYEIGEYVSLLYSKNEKKFYVEWIDYDSTYDEFTYEIDENENFDGMNFGDVYISKEDFQDFKELVSKVA